jgi:hypothetical protein
MKYKVAYSFLSEWRVGSAQESHNEQPLRRPKPWKINVFDIFWGEIANLVPH